MLQRCLAIAGVTLVALLGVPRESAAGLADIIWGMSGPQMIGAVAHCRVPLAKPDGRTIADCHILNRANPDASRQLPFWVSIESGIYGSTYRNSDSGDEYSWFDVGMFTAEPLVEWRWKGSNIRSGIGPGYNFLFGKNFDAFSRFNVKVRLLAIESGQTDLAVNMRVYPKGFTSEDFGFEPAADTDRPAEVNIGFSVGFRKLWWW